MLYENISHKLGTKFFFFFFWFQGEAEFYKIPITRGWAVSERCFRYKGATLLIKNCSVLFDQNACFLQATEFIL